jgi:tungstate transport system substrate-binding protein
MKHNLSNRNWAPAVLAVALSAGLAQAQSSTVRLAVVFTPEDSGLLAQLLPDFEKQTGYQVEVDSRQDVYDQARKGQADLVISHYGHSQVDAFLADGLGLLPRIVFANQAALIGPLGDPAGVRGLRDLVAAFRRIAETRTPFVVDSSETEAYLSEFLWEAAGRPNRDDWYFDEGLQGPEAVRDAATRRGYTLWGLVPFLLFQERSGIEMEASVVDDPLLQRFMACVVVNPDRIKGVNVEGAKALQKYLMTPATQAKIRAFRRPGFPHQMWWPGARNNSGAFLMNR